jgi:hypothetical protein
MGAPVFSRSSFTWFAEIFTVVVLIIKSGFKVSEFQGFNANPETLKP